MATSINNPTTNPPTTPPVAGITTATNPTGANPSTTPTADAVNGLLSQNNPYIQQAKSAGMDVANSRGLLNSSIAAGASQKAAYDAAVPIATNDANIGAAANLQSTQIASNEKIAADQNTANLAVANLSATTQTTIAGMNITAAAKQQAAAIISQEKIASQQIQSTADVANLQAKTQQSIAAMNISDADKQQLLSLAANQRIADQSQSTQLQVANMNVSSNQQDKASAAAVSYANIYATSVNAINSNTSMPAAARSQALQDALTLYNNSMNLVEQTYNVELQWGQTAPSAPAFTPTAPAVAPKSSAPAAAPVAVKAPVVAAKAPAKTPVSVAAPAVGGKVKLPSGISFGAGLGLNLK